MIRRLLADRLAEWRRGIEAVIPRPNPRWEELRASILGDPAEV